MIDTTRLPPTFLRLANAIGCLVDDLLMDIDADYDEVRTRAQANQPPDAETSAMQPCPDASAPDAPVRVAEEGSSGSSPAQIEKHLGQLEHDLLSVVAQCSLEEQEMVLAFARWTADQERLKRDARLHRKIVG
jgi:hypothetical protein